jgi:hypothetical protein
LNSFTDVSNLDFGDVFGTQWFAIRWSDNCLCYHITLKEFFPIVVAIEIWGNQLRNKCVTFFTDNIAVECTFNKQTLKHKLIMKLVRRFVLLILKYNIFLKASHIAGINNAAADHLSRLQMEQFREDFPHMDPKPVVQSMEMQRF